MTLNSRLATAAPAMVHRMINRSRTRVFLPVVPSRNGLRASAAIVNGAALMFAGYFGELQKTDLILAANFRSARYRPSGTTEYGGVIISPGL